MKNPQFLADQAENLAILPIHGIVIFTKFHMNWTKIVDFSLIAYFGASAIFYDSVSRIHLYVKLTINTYLNTLVCITHHGNQ